MHRYNQRGWKGSGLGAKPSPLHPCGQLTRCFSAVAELLGLVSQVMSHGIDFPKMDRVIDRAPDPLMLPYL